MAPGSGGGPQAGGLFDHLAAIGADGATPFTSAVDRVLAQPGPPGLTIVLSDLLTSEWETGVRRLPARRGELSVVHVLDPSDLEPVLSGDLELVDRETGARVEVSLTSSVIADYRELADRWVNDVAARVAASGGNYLRVFTTDDLERVLLGRAREAGVLR